jgi:hypothetical protein
MPGTVESASQASSSTFPLAIAVQPMVMHTTEYDNIAHSENTNATTFTGIEVPLFSSASLGSHFGYYLAVPVAVTNEAAEIGIESANLIYRDVLGDASGALNFRIGKFILFTPFNPMFSLGAQAPLVYDGEHYNPTDGHTSANEMNVSEAVFGVSAYGTNYNIAQGLRWELAFVGGNRSDINLKEAHAYFASLDQTIYVENAPLRVGGFLFGGTQAVSNTFQETTSMPGMPGMGTTVTEALGGAWDNELLRLGADLEITDPWMKRFTAFALYTTGKDHNVDSLGTVFEMSGGFVGVNAILLPESLYAYARYDFMTMGATNDKQTAVDVGVRYQPLPNVIVTGGFTTMLERAFNESGTVSSSISTNTFMAGFLFGF